MKHCKSTVNAEAVSPMKPYSMKLSSRDSTSDSPSPMTVPSSRGMSRQWEQRDSVHVNCLAIDNDGTLQVSMLLAIASDDTP